MRHHTHSKTHQPPTCDACMRHHTHSKTHQPPTCDACMRHHTHSKTHQPPTSLPWPERSLGYNTCIPPDNPRLQKQIQLSMGVKSGNGNIMLIAITPSPICALQHQKDCISPQLEVRLYVARHPLTVALVEAQGRCSKKDCTRSKNARLNSGISIAPGGETFGCSNLHAASQLAQTPVNS